MHCDKIVERNCAKGHVQKRRCQEAQPLICKICDTNDKRDQATFERDVELQNKRLKAQIKHDMDIAAIDMKIRKIREEVEDKKTALERSSALEQRKNDLEAARRLATQYSQQASQKPSSTTPPAPTPKTSQPTPSTPAPKTAQAIQHISTPEPSARESHGKVSKEPDEQDQKTQDHPKLAALEPSPSELEWERQKRVEGASNDAINDLMALTGLEAVKEKFLDIKSKIETVQRQGIDMKKERMGMVMLGNPGTGTCFESSLLPR
jgi:hypothetical protein